jgi:hypothetical protein
MRWSFSYLCYFHAAIDLLTGGAMLFDLDATARAVHGADVAAAMFSQPEPLLLRISQSLVAVLLIIISLLLVATSAATEVSFQRRFCKFALATHALMALYRFQYQSQVPILKNDIPGQLVGDALFAVTWLVFLLLNPATAPAESKSK